MIEKDLTGQRFGSLVVLSEHPEPYREPKTGKACRRWICKCDCGKETVVIQKALSSGETRSCGCRRRNGKDLTGQRFGRLVVLSEHPEPYRSLAGKPTRRWICRCDCGKETVVLENTLTSGDACSCGCLQRERAAASIKI